LGVVFFTKLTTGVQLTLLRIYLHLPDSGPTHLYSNGWAWVNCAPARLDAIASFLIYILSLFIFCA